MKNVTVITHPLVQHNVARLRGEIVVESPAVGTGHFAVAVHAVK